MSGPTPTGNGCSLEDCYTNIFALTDICGIKWRKLCISPIQTHIDPLEDPVLSTYAKCLQADILCVWRRVAKYSEQRPTDISFGKELWLFWYGDPPSVLEDILSPVLIEHEHGSWEKDSGLSYECRTLLFKALHNLIERCLLSKNFIRLGRWFVQPHDPCLGPEQSTNLSFSFNFFLHGESTVCASIEVKQHPPVVFLATNHLSHSQENGTQLQVILAPYGLNGSLTGVTYRDSDHQTRKQLDEWKQFYPLKTEEAKENDLNKLPNMVEVIVAGVRMKYPSCYVLLVDDISHRAGDTGMTPRHGNMQAPPTSLEESLHPNMLKMMAPPIYHQRPHEPVSELTSKTNSLFGSKLLDRVSQDCTITAGLAKRSVEPMTEEALAGTWDFADTSSKSNCNCNYKEKFTLLEKLVIIRKRAVQAIDQLGSYCSFHPVMPRKRGWRRSEARVVEAIARKATVVESQMSSQANVSSLASQSPANSPASQSPANLSANQSPANSPACQSPANLLANQSPANSPASQSPANLPASQSPATSSASNIMFKHANANVTNVKQSNTNKYNLQLITANTYSIHDHSEVRNTQRKAPFNSNIFIQGSFSQNDRQFSEQSRGSQCVANALCSLVYAKYSNLHEIHCLDKILVEGDVLYKQIITDLKRCSKYKSHFLKFDEIPQVVSVMAKSIEVEKSDVIYGNCIDQFADIEFPSMHQALQGAFRESPYLLVMVGAVCSAVFHKDNEYWIFDSHPHNSNGMATEEGKSVLLSFSGIEDLATYMYALYSSMGIDLYSQYEMLPMHFNERTIYVGVRAWETVHRSKQNKQKIDMKSNLVKSDCNLLKSKLASEKNEQDETISNFMKNLKEYSGDNKTVTLIGRYISEQSRKLSKKNKDRRQYQQFYKLKQRQQEKYRANEKSKERVLKQKARESSDVRAKERQKERELKQKARESSVVRAIERQKERELKQKARESSVVRAKERQKERELKQKARESIEFRANERELKQKARESSDVRAKERQKERELKQKARESSVVRAKERQKERELKQKARESIEFRANERELKQKARESSDIRAKERQKERELKQKARESSVVRAKERHKERELKQKARESIEFRANERELKQKARESIDVRAKERQKERELKQKARESSVVRAKERQKERELKQKARESIEFRAKERELKQKARESSDVRAKERQKERELKQKVRQSCDRKSKERQFKQQERENVHFRENEKVYEKASKRRKRLIDEYRKWEVEQKKKSRESIEFQQKESEMQRQSKRKARMDPKQLEIERLRKQQWRSNNRNKETEKILDTSQKAMKRQNKSYQEYERQSAKQRRYGKGIDSCIQIFEQTISEGPIYICSCCHQTWFKHSVNQASVLNTENRNRYLTGKVSAENKEWLCGTCKTSILNKRIPKLSVYNGMMWPEKVPQLDLFSLEERLIALRIPFMQMRELPRGRQLSVKGNVVNVPVDIQPVVKELPRPFNEDVTVAVKLKKKMSFQSCAFSENVRPVRVLVALHWLMKNSDLYKNANVDIDEEWINSVTETCNEIVQEFVSNNECDTGKTKQTLSDFSYHEQTCTENYTEANTIEESCDSDTEEVSKENVGNIDTLLDDANLENRNNSSFIFAPGEGQRPLSIYQDKDSEFLCFPTIFCGQRRKENEDRHVPLSYGDIAKWELRSDDRRAANSVPNIFFKLKKVQMKQLNDKVNLAVRRCQGDTSTLTAEQARNSDEISNIIKKDEGYYIFKQLRNSPAYLETKKKDVFAMIRQLGLPTWFLSLSSADTRWNDLLKMLASLNKKVDYTDEQIANLTWQQKTELVQSDPVTCSRYFDNRVQKFINTILKSDHKPLGTVTDYFYRVEFQQRGSPHIHMIVWIKDAPKWNVDSNEAITSFVDEYLQCRIDDEDMDNLPNLQAHKHSQTCGKKQDRLCRFGYPLPPLPQTMVLEPLETEKEKYEKMYQKLQKEMNDKKDGYNMSYDQFLDTVAKMSEDDYIKCIRSSLKTSKVFMKRSPSEIRINLYNKTVLKAWKANIDIQFVLDPYACAMYIVSYISKSQRGMSTLLHAAAKEARNGNMDIKRQVRHIGNVFSNSVEVSAQEACYLILQMPLTKSTRDVVFINTSPPNKRVQLLKPKSALEELPAKSKDIIADNVVKRYARRPKILEHYCLADYVSQLDVIYPTKETETIDEERNDDDFSLESDTEQFDESKVIQTLKNGIKIKRRSNYKVIRYVRFNRKTDEENHFREKLLLFHPWRNEERDLLSNYNTYREHYESKKHQIDQKSNYYEHHVEELELAKDLAEADHDAYDEIAPGAQQTEADTAEETTVNSEAFIYFNPETHRATEHTQYDIGIEIGCSTSQPQVNVNENILSDEEYRTLLRCLNTKQKQFYNHVIHWIKTKDAPLYAFLSGGAGVGKSVVIRALYQTLYRHLNLKGGENVDDICVLLCAYTGKAAFNIGGSTVSKAFYQKYKQSDQTLTCDKLNTFRSKYKSLSVVIIDEVSMVGNWLLSFIDQRLQELKGTRQPFGGVSIIVVGDLFQLRPVGDNWIFNDMKHAAAVFSTNLWKEHFKMFELTEIMRQRDDYEFAELLNRLRKNVLTEEDRVKLSKCKIEFGSPEHMLHAPHLFAENSFMTDFNNSILDQTENEKIIIPCFDAVISPKLSQQKQDEAIRALQRVEDLNLTANLQNSLTIVIGMIYDLTVNTNTEDGLANGASCIVKFVEYKQREKTNRPSIIWVQFHDKKAGNETRKKFKNRGFYHNQIQNDWTPIFDIERSFTYNRKTFQRIQFPLRPSAGRTVHRAQGTTLDKVVIDLSQKHPRQVPHLHYVALSRVRSMENLQILNFNEQSLKVDERVETELERLHTNAMLDLCYMPLENIESDTHFKVAFNNCTSFHKYFEDIKQDQGLLSCHMFGLAESRLLIRDKDCDYKIEGFGLIRNDQKPKDAARRPPHGLVLYVKESIHSTVEKVFSSSKFEFIKINVTDTLFNGQLIVLYKAPNMLDSEFSSTVDKELLPYIDKTRSLVIMGDFNLDVQRKHAHIQILSKKFTCTSHISEPTTDKLSVIDHVFSNIDGVSGTIETYWSDHKIVFFYTNV